MTKNSIAVSLAVALLAGFITSACRHKATGNDAAFTCNVAGGNKSFIMVSGSYPSGVTDSFYAFDANLNSAAGVTLYGSSSSTPTLPTQSQQANVIIRVTAPSGTTFPAGSRPGVIFGLPTGNNVQYSATITTYLSNTQQETRTLVANHTGPTGGEVEYLGYPSSSPATLGFDAVELNLTETNPNTERHDYRAFEFCGDGAPR